MLTVSRYKSVVGSRMCENEKTFTSDRTSYSFKTILRAHRASPFKFEIALKNIILVALRVFQFSHGLVQKARTPCEQIFSALT
jgi:hypothetical protein